MWRRTADRMNIAILIEKFDPAAGGAERSTEQIARRLVERGHSVTILTGRAAPDAMSGVTIRACPGLPPKFAAGLIHYAHWSTRELARGKFDVSLSMTTAAPAAVVEPRGGTVRETLARNVAMRSTELKRLLKQISIALTPKQLALLAAERRTLNSPLVKKIVAISPYVADQLFHHYTISSRRIALIPNAAEIRPMSQAERAALRDKTRDVLGLEPYHVVFFFAAMNPGLKGLSYLLDAFAKLKPVQPRARLIVAGTLAHRPQEQVHALGLSHEVKWVGPTRQMDALYTAADVTVLPTWYDPSSKVILESLLHGVPAVSTRYNGASQWIAAPQGEPVALSPFDENIEMPAGEGQAGRVIASPTDVAALERAMAELCDDDLRARCAAATTGLAARISMDVHVDALEQVLIEAASTPSPSGRGLG
ncbi:MAG: glycosyltransferase [Planctomycetes bacterium]|nr:glycosyltransferase [Planctomycetota bacterium]